MAELELIGYALVNGLSVRAPELAVWTLSIALYCILVYRFYHFVAKRDVFGFNPIEVELERVDSFRQLSGTFSGFIKYGVFFPVVVFVWFAGFSVLFFFLAKALTVSQIILICISFVTAIRLASYYSEDLSKDMAKLIPFVLLGIAVVEPNFFSLGLVFERVNALSVFLWDLPVYFFFVLLVEWVLRVLLAIKHGLFGVSMKKKAAD